MTQQFYKVCQQYQTIENLEKTLSISKDRLKKEQYDFDFGQNSKLDVLNASVDFNIDSINLLQATNQLSNDKLILNQLMGVAISTEYIAQTNIAFDGEINLEMLTKQAFENNTALNQYEKNILLSQFDTKIIRANWLPKLNVSGSYAFNNTNNDANSGFNSPLATNYINSYGPSAQLSLTWNLFDGGKTLTQLQNAAIIIENKQIDLAAQKLKLERDITISWQNYKNALAILQIQNQNLETNKLNFLRTQEKYKIGQVNSIQFRQAQQNLLNAENNLNIAKYSAKSLELNLKMQAGKLLESLK